MAILSDFVASGTSNIQYATVAVSAIANGNLVLPGTTFFNVPFNAKLADPYNIVTLNTSLSTITLPSGLYSINVTVAGVALGVQNVSTRLRSDSTTVCKWPVYRVLTNGTSFVDLERSGVQQLTPAGLYLGSQTSVSLQQYWSAGVTLQSPINDTTSNIYYIMDIWKHR